ncbi:MAG: oligosaccharide flippase family protein [Flavobacteriia bacterium]|nr:oligosaccharide flippase family protein [Flavobacteriia bacterium]
MGLVIRQSFFNTISTYLGFGLGAINTLVLYTRILPVDQYGLLSIMLSAASILMPIFIFGLPNTLIKFYTAALSPKEAGYLNGFSLWFPMLLIGPAMLGVYFFDGYIITALHFKNAFVAPYLWHILFIGVGMAYFEIAYAQAKVALKSVWGNFLKEVSHRLFISGLLLLLYGKFIDLPIFFGALVGVHIFRALLMHAYVLWNCDFNYYWGLPKAYAQYLQYSGYMFLGGTAAVIILEIDKLMIYTYVNIEQVAFYTVAVFMATIVGVPARSMYQITAPITARLLQDNDLEGLKKLYKESSLNLGMVAGGVLMLLLINLDQIYRFIPQAYGGTFLLVLLIGLSKFYDALMGNNNAILFNSPYYKKILSFGLLLACMTIVLNYFLIPSMGIEGAALASFLSIGFYNSVKIWYVWKKYHTHPFSGNTIKLMLLLGTIYLASFFLPNFENRYLGIAFDTLFVGSSYVAALYISAISEVFNALIDRNIQRFRGQ